MSQLVIKIDLARAIPVYRQIEDAVRALIVEGQLRAGDRLPTVRDLALDLAVHHNTVAQAYRELAEEGWLELGRRRGATVIDRAPPRSTAANRRLFAQRARELVAKAQADGLSRGEIATILIDLISQERNS